MMCKSKTLWLAIIFSPTLSWGQIDHVTASVDDTPPTAAPSAIRVSAAPGESDASVDNNAALRVRIQQMQQQQQQAERRAKAVNRPFAPRHTATANASPAYAAPAATPPASMPTATAASATTPASKPDVVSTLGAVLFLMLAGIGITVLVAGLAMARRGILVIYAGWPDVILAGACLATVVMAGYGIAQNMLGLCALPLVMGGMLLWRAWWLNRSLPKALLALPSQLIGALIVLGLGAIALGALVNIFNKQPGKTRQNDLEKRVENTVVFGISVGLGTLLWKGLNAFMATGRATADRLQQEKALAVARVS